MWVIEIIGKNSGARGKKLNSQFSSANQVEAIGRVLRPVSPIPVLSHRWQTVGTNKQ